MTVPDCARCGRAHVTSRGGQACSGHVKTDRSTYVPGKGSQPLPEPRPCRTAPMYGLTVCAAHGGKAAHAKRAGQQRMQRAEAERLVVTLGEPIDDGRDYSDIIAERVGIRRGHVAWLLARVQAIDPDSLAWGITKRKTAVDIDRPSDEQDDGHERRHFAGTDEGDTFEAKPSIWYAMYVDAARDLEKLCIEAIRVGVEQRRLQMDERMADVWVRAIDGIVTALGHDPNAPETAQIVARHLELVA